MLISLQKSEEVRVPEPRYVRVFLQRFSSFLFFAPLQKRKEAKVKPQTYKRIKTDLNTKWQIMKCTYRDRECCKGGRFPKNQGGSGSESSSAHHECVWSWLIKVIIKICRPACVDLGRFPVPRLPYVSMNLIIKIPL